MIPDPFFAFTGAADTQHEKGGALPSCYSLRRLWTPAVSVSLPRRRPLQPARLALKITAPHPPAASARRPRSHAPSGLLCASQPVNANEPLADQNGGYVRMSQE
jgi:hypothetical protein